MPAITKRHIMKVAKISILVLFVMAIAVATYYAYATVMLSNRVKIHVVSSSGKPITNRNVVFRSTECRPSPCSGKVLAEVKTSLFGNATLTTKELPDSFIVEADGYKPSEEYLRLPGSLQFSRQNDSDFYSVDISQGDLHIVLKDN